MYLNERQLLLILRAFAPDNREYPTEEEEQTANEIREKSTNELIKRYGYTVRHEHS